MRTRSPLRQRTVVPAPGRDRLAGLRCSSARMLISGTNRPPGSTRGSVGLVQAYLDASLRTGTTTVFASSPVPSSFQPPARTSSTLGEPVHDFSSGSIHGWVEEFRQIGIRTFLVVATNLSDRSTVVPLAMRRSGDFPVRRGWALRDHWALLGEHLRVEDEYGGFRLAENDGRVGWAARTR